MMRVTVSTVALICAYVSCAFGSVLYTSGEADGMVGRDWYSNPNSYWVASTGPTIQSSHDGDSRWWYQGWVIFNISSLAGQTLPAGSAVLTFYSLGFTDTYLKYGGTRGPILTTAEGVDASGAPTIATLNCGEGWMSFDVTTHVQSGINAGYTNIGFVFKARNYCGGSLAASEDPDHRGAYLQVGPASVPEPEMDVQGNSVSIVDGDATPSLTDHTDFGSALVTGRTLVRTYTITNSGTATLNLTSNPIVVTSGDFTVSSQPTASVAAGGTTTFQVTFDPAALGSCSGTLSIANDDADENPYNFSIQGMGTTPPEMHAPELGPGGTVVIRWTSYTNHLYTVHHSTNLLNGFSELQSHIQATPSLNTYTDGVNGVSTKFWKVSTGE